MIVHHSLRGLRGLGLTQSEFVYYTSQRALLMTQFNDIMAISCVGFGGEDAAWQQQQCEAQKASQAGMLMSQIQAIDAMLSQGVSVSAPAPAPAGAPAPASASAPASAAPSAPIAPTAGGMQPVPGSPSELEVQTFTGTPILPAGSGQGAPVESGNKGLLWLALAAAGLAIAGS